ncbi:MAG: rRNA-processing protein and EBNA1-binding protein ebp2 [Stictis urceolatum]|nr:rRNA-processing protein and EBNA1-binding protein ebp2 [Stictis urceolata]
MPKSSKLLSALDRRKGRNYKLEKQRGQEKAARKRKNQYQNRNGDAIVRENADGTQSDSHGDWEDEEAEKTLAKKVSQLNGTTASHDPHKTPASAGGAEITPNEAVGIGSASAEDSDASVSDEEASDAESNGIPFSDIESLDSEDKADIISHQRLTINNTSALLAAHKSIAIPKSLPFSTNQSVTSSAQIEIADVHDDLTREQAFYKQCLDAAVEGRARLRKEGVPFTRPNDYFAEMVKTDEHMGKIKAKMVEEAANKKAAAEARKQRDLKKFGKSVQVAKLQERDKAKRETLEKINVLKRKRKDAEPGAANEADLFDVALEDEISKPDRPRKGGKDSKPGVKRQKKDAKFGHGGKKRFSKSGDALSSGDLRKFSTKKMKGGRSAPRPGKSKRVKKL